MCATPRALTRFSRPRLLLFDRVEQRVWHAQVLYLSSETSEQSDRAPRRTMRKASTHRATTYVALFQFPEAVAVCARLVYFAERDVHKVVAVDEVSVECFSVLELDQLCGNVQRDTE